MLAGKIKTKVDLYQLLPDTANNNEYQFYKTINAELTYKSGNQIIQSYQIFNTKSITIRIRNRKDIDELMLVKVGSEIYDIMYIQPVSGFNSDLIVYLTISNKPFKMSVDIKGVEALKQGLRNLDSKLRKTILMKSFNKAAKPIIESAK